MARSSAAKTGRAAEPTAGASDAWQDGGMTIAEAVSFAGVGRSTIYGLMDAGRLPYTKVGRRRVVARRGLVALLASGIG